MKCFNYFNGLTTNILKKNPTLNNIKIFPNPAQNYLDIYTGTTTENILQIVDTKGNKILTEKIIDHKRINTENLPSGIYLIKIQTTNGEITTKNWIKQ